MNGKQTIVNHYHESANLLASWINMHHARLSGKASQLDTAVNDHAKLFRGAEIPLATLRAREIMSRLTLADTKIALVRAKTRLRQIEKLIKQLTPAKFKEAA